MFETMQAFYLFFFPTLVLIIVGIVFEEKLVALEQRIARRLRKNRQPAEKARPALQKMERCVPARPANSRSNRAA